MKVVALCGYPVEAAATRLRVVQFTEYLSAKGIELSVRPFLDGECYRHLYDRAAWRRTAVGVARSIGRRLRDDLATARKADVVLVQREAMLLGPPIVEWLVSQRAPLVLDLDDATYLSYASPTYGSVARLLKWPGKTDWVIRHAAMVTCGSWEVADHVTELGTPTRLIPTVVDTSRFRPGPRAGVGDLVTVGWIGSHSTYPYLADLFGVLRDVAAAVPFRLLVIGGGRQVPDVPGVTVEQRDWTLEGEVRDFQSLDIGLYPLRADGWAQGKSGLKAIQYMSVGVPFVATPVGATADLGLSGTTHLLARSREEWYEALRLLLEDHQLRWRMGTAGREHALERYTIANAGRGLEQALRDSCSPARCPQPGSPVAHLS